MSSNTELLERIADALERIANAAEKKYESDRESVKPKIKVADTWSGLYINTPGQSPISEPQKVKESDRYCKDV